MPPSVGATSLGANAFSTLRSSDFSSVPEPAQEHPRARSALPPPLGRSGQSLDTASRARLAAPSLSNLSKRSSRWTLSLR